MAKLTLKEQAYQQLRILLLSGELQSDEQLTENYLVELLQMSRTPIRSALERLTAEGLLSYAPNKGLRLNELSIQRVIDFFDVRIALEGHIVKKLAARVWQECEVAWFRSNLAEQEAAMRVGDYAAFSQKDADYHRQLALLYDNQEIIQLMDNLQDKLFQIPLKILRKNNQRIEQAYLDHVSLLEFMCSGAGDKAHALMVEHLEHGARILVM